MIDKIFMKCSTTTLQVFAFLLLNYLKRLPSRASKFQFKTENTNTVYLSNMQNVIYITFALIVYSQETFLLMLKNGDDIISFWCYGNLITCLHCSA